MLYLVLIMSAILLLIAFRQLTPKRHFHGGGLFHQAMRETQRRQAEEEKK